MIRPATSLLDEDARPHLRARIGALMAGARTADFAVARIRLAVLDLRSDELDGLERCRVLLGHLDASALLDAADGPGGAPGIAPAMAGLLRFARSERLEVRSAGLHGWTPDFALFHGPDGATGLVGAIHFESPDLVVGPLFTVVTEDPAAAALLARRFDEAWERAHDVLPAIRDVLERVHAVVADAAPRGGGPHPG